MTGEQKAALFQWINLHNRRINLGLIAGRVVMVFGGRAPAGAITVDRLDAVVDDPEGVTADGRTLAIGALGIAAIAEHLATIDTYARSPRALHDRLCDLVRGPFASEMIAATIRVASGHPGVGGDTTLYIDHAKRQMQSWSDGDTAVVMRL